MKRDDPEAEKKLTLLALKFSSAGTHFKAIEPGIVYAPDTKLINVKGQEEATIFHLCKPFALVEALSTIDDIKFHLCIEIWRRHCGIMFPQSSDKLFCSKCFKEFDASLNKKLSIIKAAGTLNL